MSFPYQSYRDWLKDEEKLGRVVRIKAPIKCGDPKSIVDVVPRQLREEHIRVLNNPGAAGKQMETELKAVNCYLTMLPGKPIGIIENPINNKPDSPIILNPWATRERVLRMCGCQDKEEFVQKYRQLSTNLIPPKKLAKKDAPVKEVIVTGKDLDLYHDVPRCWVEFETLSWGPTGGGQWVVYDPVTKTHDLGEWRSGFFDWQDGDPAQPFPEERRKRDMLVILGYKGPQASDGGRYYAKNERLNKPTPAAYVMCPDPALSATASARLPLMWPEDGIDEYAAHGGLLGKPVELVEAETIPGLMVPAHAEYVIEGELLPNDHYPIPAYAEGFFMGYLLGGSMSTAFRATCVTHRKDAMWCSTWSANSSSSGHEGPHSALLYLTCEAEAINYLRDCGHNVRDIVAYDMGLIVIQADRDGLEKPMMHYGKVLASALYGCPNGFIGNTNKYYVVVGPDINPYDLRDVVWAINTRSEPVSDSILIEKGSCPWADPSGTPSPANRNRRTFGEQMFIDALIKVPERYEAFPPRTEPLAWEKAEIERIRKKIGAK